MLPTHNTIVIQYQILLSIIYYYPGCIKGATGQHKKTAAADREIHCN